MHCSSLRTLLPLPESLFCEKQLGRLNSTKPSRFRIAKILTESESLNLYAGRSSYKTSRRCYTVPSNHDINVRHTDCAFWGIAPKQGKSMHEKVHAGDYRTTKGWYEWISHFSYTWFPAMLKDYVRLHYRRPSAGVYAPLAP